MELLEKLGIDGRLLLWQVINFAILFVVLRKFAYRPILEILRKRAETIQKGFEDAEKAKAALHDAREEREKIIREARKQASAILNDAEQSGREIRELESQKTKEQVKMMIESGKSDVAREREGMLKEAKKEIGALVALGVDKVVGRAAPKIDFEPIVAEAIREIQK
ncbi:ATP synthase F0 subunit B [Candidatus Uhrbacteria bacterium RIFCSPHIGHO2_12_FULL_57_11]|uniref:ATP synthase subunit b n=1 Tax=Candidatus Uhrbacteria bacterium RIFCSPHIGHO2_12_FULL_57_11 TaxID=1802398 RepID=A0A1F7UMJ5_9BACT|nr:MAG: ATP synthase F0 subunit B [Candidatus Uhrbacteria bacterium RIFCSPHIGHO2_12_FULL_57_11]